MRSFEETLVLLLGGRDKHLPLEELVQECKRRCRAVVLFGESATLFEAAFAAARSDSDGLTVTRAETLEQATSLAKSLSQPGDVVLLSPACTSFDAYQNFEERGAHFRSLVNSLHGGATPRTKEIA
jgi:UDP-N-acetylmuramoylalanine--D-glutamate ligase